MVHAKQCRDNNRPVALSHPLRMRAITDPAVTTFARLTMRPLPILPLRRGIFSGSIELRQELLTGMQLPCRLMPGFEGLSQLAPIPGHP